MTLIRVVATLVASIIFAFLLSPSIAISADDPEALPSKKGQDKEAVIRQWLDRSLQFAYKLESEELANAALSLIETHVSVGDWRRVKPLIDRIKSGEIRDELIVYLPSMVADSGDLDVAFAMAEKLGKEPRKSPIDGRTLWSDRNLALNSIALRQIPSHKFANAEMVLRMIDDPQAVFNGLAHIAEYQAKAGLYEDATATLAKVEAKNADEENEYDRVKKIIVSCRATKRKDPPLGNLGLIASLRVVNTIFSDFDSYLSLSDLEKAEKEVDTLDGSSEKSSAWRQIAWAYYRKKDLPRCRQAIQKSLDNVEEISNSYLKAVTYVSLADLYLELGETDLAKQMAQRQTQFAWTRSYSAVLHSFTTTPLLVSILIRVGDVDGAAAIIEKIGKMETDPMQSMFLDLVWNYWAAVCALEGKMDDIERRIEKTESNRIKAVICAGTAFGLRDKQRSQKAVKPR